jgi:hypothetical protein
MRWWACIHKDLEYCAIVLAQQSLFLEWTDICVLGICVLCGSELFIEQIFDLTTFPVNGIAHRVSKQV